jgi:hypothetical protein
VMEPFEENFLEAFERLQRRRNPLKRQPRPPLKPRSAPPAKRHANWTREEIVEAMLRFQAEQGRRLTADVATYHAREYGVPGINTVIRRFGSWSAGTIAAYGTALGRNGQIIEPAEPEKKKGEVKLKVLSSTKPTKRELKERAVAWTTEEPA